MLGPQRDFKSHEGTHEINGLEVQVHWSGDNRVGWYWRTLLGNKTDGPFKSSYGAYEAAEYALTRRR